MLAVKDQLPGVEAVKQASQSTASIGGGSELWGQLRRLKAQLGQLELVVSTIKRDVARIDRKQYREVEKEPPTLPTLTETAFPDGLFS